MVRASVEGLVNIPLVHVKYKDQSSPVHPDRQDRACQKLAHAPVISPKEEESNRPKHIKLLFDRQRPGMTKSGIWIAVQRLIIIIDVKQSRQRLRPHNPGVPDEVHT